MASNLGPREFSRKDTAATAQTARARARPLAACTRRAPGPPCRQFGRPQPRPKGHCGRPNELAAGGAARHRRRPDLGARRRPKLASSGALLRIGGRRVAALVVVAASHIAHFRPCRPAESHTFHARTLPAHSATRRPFGESRPPARNLASSGRLFRTLRLHSSSAPQLSAELRHSAIWRGAAPAGCMQCGAVRCVALRCLALRCVALRCVASDCAESAERAGH